MSHDIQIRRGPSLPTLPDDLYPPNPTGAPIQQSPMQKVHRLLRGRYGLAITLGLLGATIGGLAGWFGVAPEQRSEAMIEIQPIVRSITTSDKVMPFYTQFLSSQPYHVTKPSVIQTAMESPEWKKVGWDMTGDGIAKYSRPLRISRCHGSCSASCCCCGRRTSFLDAASLMSWPTIPRR